MLENLPTVVTVKQLSEFLQVHEMTILRALKANKLKGFKVEKVWRIEKSAVLQWIDTK